MKKTLLMISLLFLVLVIVGCPSGLDGEWTAHLSTWPQWTETYDFQPWSSTDGRAGAFKIWTQTNKGISSYAYFGDIEPDEAIGVDDTYWKLEEDGTLYMKIVPPGKRGSYEKKYMILAFSYIDGSMPGSVKVEVTTHINKTPAPERTYVLVKEPI